MLGESPTKASTPTDAVFLSYASQDAEAAQRICEALRAAGIEVWFDQSELRGGDAWDQSIRKQIKTCALFLPVISHTTHDRREGYFRLEWKLAIDRCHLMDANLAFLLPVVIDDTRDDDERVPERFREVQWTRLPAGETSPAFVERVRRLLSGETSTPVRAGAASAALPAIEGRSPTSGWWRRVLPVTAAVLVLGAVAYLAIERPWISRQPPALSTPAPAAFAAPPHSVAVLPFVNMSGDKEQEYFSDGLTEELLNSLARINELQVSARTSSFSFKGKDTDIATIARKLNVAAVLEGSIRRSGSHLRITTQLVNATSGFNIWSQTYDREVGDVLTLESEIAAAVTGALQVALLGDPTKKIELGGTRNPAAFDAYLRGWKLRGDASVEQQEGSIAAFGEAIQHDPHYALAFAGRSLALLEYSQKWGILKGKDARGAAEKAMADALHVTKLAPDLADGHLALAEVWESRLDFISAGDEYRRALALAPGYARAWRDFSEFIGNMGNIDSAVSAARRSVSLDPLNAESLQTLGDAFLAGRRYQEALRVYEEWQRREPQSWGPRVLSGYVYYFLGNFQRAATMCEGEGPPVPVQGCLALAYHKLGRLAEAEASLEKIVAVVGDASPTKYAQIYAQWGQTDDALRWLETAWRQRHVGLEGLKTWPAFDPLRTEPRFQAIEKALRFSD
jgi:TolB-like protein